MPGTTPQTDIVIKYNKKEYPVPVGFTAEDFRDSLVIRFPELTNSTLIKDAEGEYTLKALVAENG